MISETVRRRAQALRAVSERLVKESYEPGDAADVLRREVETALHALQEAMRQSSQGDPESDSSPGLRWRGGRSLQRGSTQRVASVVSDQRDGKAYTTRPRGRSCVTRREAIRPRPILWQQGV